MRANLGVFRHRIHTNSVAVSHRANIEFINVVNINNNISSCFVPCSIPTQYGQCRQSRIGHAFPIQRSITGSSQTNLTRARIDREKSTRVASSNRICQTCLFIADTDNSTCSLIFRDSHTGRQSKDRRLRIKCQNAIWPCRHVSGCVVGLDENSAGAS